MLKAVYNGSTTNAPPVSGPPPTPGFHGHNHTQTSTQGSRLPP